MKYMQPSVTWCLIWSRWSVEFFSYLEPSQEPSDMAADVDTLATEVRYESHGDAQRAEPVKLLQERQSVRAHTQPWALPSHNYATCKDFSKWFPRKVNSRPVLASSSSTCFRPATWEAHGLGVRQGLLTDRCFLFVMIFRCQENSYRKKKKGWEWIVQEWRCRKGMSTTAPAYVTHLTLPSSPECTHHYSTILGSQASPQLSASLCPPDLMMILPTLALTWALHDWWRRAYTHNIEISASSPQIARWK